jgi:hypothetical protein
MAEIKYANGIYWNKKHEKAPSFVLGSISIKPEMFIEWLKAQTPNEKGYVRLKVNDGRDGKPFVALDDWTPNQVIKKEVETMSYEDDIPFI